MGMDGLFRPSQALGYTDTLGHLNAAERAKEDARQAHQVSQHREVDAIDKDPKQRQEGGRDEGGQPEKDTAFEEELKEVIIQQFNIDFVPGVVYRFVFNESNDKIELVDTSNQQVLLTLTPEAFIQVTANMRRNSGIMTDHSA